ncbi:pyridine nucleotide-disulfide oxidoreductase [Acidihalobacter yilgarnensis]|uniref:Pyridine nucleotide-disulfide oxidoreductase n=1 Tax=Acidihalobacter yilgarnensis TaxID=2819280 RepID=A0A1D8IND4_9GAMM|nr:bifunctional TVP38/TMEM64 family protein/FAD-dependent oxidoreductase [Acidihalobacter yilgarnensis]AOU97977.1 pyridine nucleotide-disulfide oxidoreductase [Acidihalobacter yilgarnensis]
MTVGLKNVLRVALILLLGTLATLYFTGGLTQELTLSALKTQLSVFADYRNAHPLLISVFYFLVYVVSLSLSLPVAALLTLAAGALFGILWGTLLVSFASTIGATIAFLMARYALRDAVQKRFGYKLSVLNAGIEREGGYYLLSLRLVPLFPVWLVNLLTGLTPLRTSTFYWTSQVGMLPGTLVYVYTGTQLSRLGTTHDIFSAQLLLAFTLLGLLPLIAKRALVAIKTMQVSRHWSRPSRFDYNVVVIGAGSAGLTASYIAAAVKAKVALVEKHRMGGDCLNTGCVPSKALLRTAKLAAHMRDGARYGLSTVRPDIDFAAVMKHVQGVVETVAPHDSADRYTSLGVHCLYGNAQIVSPFTVEVTDETGKTQRLTTRSIILATGAHPRVPLIPGLADVGYLTSDNVWSLRELPTRLVVLGGGPIGCELAQAFARLGAQVTLIEIGSQLLPREDIEVSTLVEECFRRDGIDVRTGHKAIRCERNDGVNRLLMEYRGEEIPIVFDKLLCALGRVANLEGYGLETLGIDTRSRRNIEVNEYLETVYPNIYACGDVAGPYQFTHTAAHQAWYATVNALFGVIRRFKVDYSTIPWVIFTDPAVARVGLNEKDAREKTIAYEITRFDLDELDRAIVNGAAYGFVKVLTVPGSDRILGATIVAECADEILTELVLAMRHGIGLNKILGTIHVYPTLAEANKYTAGAWKRAHAPQRLMNLFARYHAWRRKESGFVASARKEAQ